VAATGGAVVAIDLLHQQHGGRRTDRPDRAPAGRRR
jgi:hypothetical protein